MTFTRSEYISFDSGAKILFSLQRDKCRSVDKKEDSIPLTLYTVTPFFSIDPCAPLLANTFVPPTLMYLSMQTYPEFNTLFVWLYS